jgi:uncharacterized membrane protein
MVVGERVRSRLWPIPAAAAVVAGLAAVLLATTRPADDREWGTGDPSSTRGLLEVLTGSSLTVTALVLSLQVVALQLAATQYSPRLLRTYVRDRVIQLALSVLIATFVFSLVTLALVSTVQRTARLSVLVAVGLGLASVGALVGVVAHIVASLRVETMMAGIHTDASNVIEGHLRDLDDPGELPEGPATAVQARRSGFLQVIDRRRLSSWARQRGAVVQIDALPGDHVLEGARLGRVVGPPGVPPPGTLLIGHERTPDDDPAYGLVQISDIAVRALSPGVNDPTTAVHGVGHLAALLDQLVRYPLGMPRVTRDDSGHVRLVEAQRGLSDYLEVAFAPVLRAGSANPRVLLALVELLAVADRHPGGTEAVAEQLDRLVGAVQRDLVDPSDVHRVLEAAAQVSRRGVAHR